MKVIVLAAGRAGLEGSSRPIIAERLGDKWILDCVIENAAQIASPADTYVVIRAAADEVREHLGPGFQYVVQEEQLGTGGAVLQCRPLCEGYEGDLLILYGDTPLLRVDAIRGLIARHHLKRADLTLLSAMVSSPLPYGRIIRDASGRIVDVVEETDASPKVREIRELNIGAYQVAAGTLFPLLEKLGSAAGSDELRLPDCVRGLIGAGLRVDGFQIYDEDDVLGINSAEDLDRAELVLRKRLFAAHRPAEENVLRFGTGGWRAIIGEGFTLHNVRRLSQALANQLIRRDQEKAGVLIGYDRRFLSDLAAEVAAGVFAANNVSVTLLPEPAPTPLVSFAVAASRRAIGLVFTASHNPPEWNGLKVLRGDGSMMQNDETARIETEANALGSSNVIEIDLPCALAAGIVTRKDFANAYVDKVESCIDMQAIRKAGLRVLFDPMYGVGKATLEVVLTEARCRVTTIHGRHDPLFGGRSPAPDLHALGVLINTLKEGDYDLGLATDGDGDRIAIVNDRGEFVHINDVLLVLYHHLHEMRGERGGVVRSLATTHLLDRLAQHYGEETYETPVGFKHIMSAMEEHGAVLGGESSGGLTVRGHIPNKDGILAAALVVEMLAKSGRRLTELRDQAYAITGRLYRVEDSMPATPEMKVLIPRLLARKAVARVASYPVVSIAQLDGTKFLLEGDNWLLVRFSGTEPLLRIYAEADSAVKARELAAWGRGLVGA